MADEGKLRKQAQRGKQAENLLKNKLLNEALDQMEEELDRTWKESRPDDHEARHNAYLMNLLLERFKGCLTQHVRTGKGATTELLNLKAGDS